MPDYSYFSKLYIPEIRTVEGLAQNLGELLEKAELSPILVMRERRPFALIVGLSDVDAVEFVTEQVPAALDLDYRQHWVVATSRCSLAGVIPDQLLAGIEERLAVSAEFLDGDEFTHSADEVRSCLRQFPLEVSNKRPDAESWWFSTKDQLLLYVTRCTGERAAADIRQLLEVKEMPRGRRNDEVQSLAEAREIVAFEFELTGDRSMAWPIALAGAAWLAEKGQGLVCDMKYEWIRPQENELVHLW